MITIYLNSGEKLSGIKAEWKYAGSDDPMGGRDLILVVTGGVGTENPQVVYEVPKESVNYVKREN